jgi:hypothetical protein
MAQVLSVFNLPMRSADNPTIPGIHPTALLAVGRSG